MLALNHLSSEYIKEDERLLLHSRSGEVSILEALKGKLLYHFPAKNIGKGKDYNLMQALLVNNALVAILEEDNFNNRTWPPRSKNRVLLIRDLSGKEVFREAFQVEDGNIDPPIWSQGSRLMLPWKNKIRTLSIGSKSK